MAISTFYFSNMQGSDVHFETQKVKGRLQDFVVDASTIRPRVTAARVRLGWQSILIDFSCMSVSKEENECIIRCQHIIEPTQKTAKPLYVAKHILDKQIVDIDGRKVVRVNDIRFAALSTGLYIVAVDVGFEGLLRRLSLARPMEKILNVFGKNLPGNLILWDDVATINPSHEGLRLSKAQAKLSKLHPSDLADILEDLDHNTQAQVFASLDEENAADVLEELEPEAQINVIESLSAEKAADVLEKMPADEAADILDDLDEVKAEELLSEMEQEASQEIRELMEYPENTVGSIMSTDYVSFNENMTIDQTIAELRRLKPDSDSIYYLYVLDDEGKLVASISLRDLVTNDPDICLKEIMDRQVIKLEDYDEIDTLAEIIGKYNLLAVPVVDKNSKMMGMVVIDDIVAALLKTKTKRRSLIHVE
ncbi:MAG: magnesium transporter [SAR324 cluster bacterium]|uniref:Magnesium transporter n=1 Tax=SAR324 cluster bacterium TaxID=2024889 RepID=A0A7X9IK68_9DELT|nr:magnesium transporter [SAR324 cluster bacterium]